MAAVVLSTLQTRQHPPPLLVVNNCWTDTSSHSSTLETGMLRLSARACAQAYTYCRLRVKPWMTSASGSTLVNGWDPSSFRMKSPSSAIPAPCRASLGRLRTQSSATTGSPSPAERNNASILTVRMEPKLNSISWRVRRAPGTAPLLALPGSNLTPSFLVRPLQSTGRLPSTQTLDQFKPHQAKAAAHHSHQIPPRHASVSSICRRPRYTRRRRDTSTIAPGRHQMDPAIIRGSTRRVA